MSLIKKTVRIKANVTPGMIPATHRRFWQYLKDKNLRVLWEDKVEMGVADEEGTQYTIRKELVEVVPGKEAHVG